MSTLTSATHRDQASPTSGIQEAIDALGDRGGVVQLDAGVYPVRCSIVLHSNVTLRGMGNATVIQMPPLQVYPLTRDIPPHTTKVRLEPGHDLRPGDQLCILEPPKGHRWYKSRYSVIDSIEPDGMMRTRTILGEPQLDYTVSRHAAGVTAFPGVLIAHVADVTVEAIAVEGPGSGPAVLHGVSMDEEFMHMAVNVHASPRCRLRDLTVRKAVTDGICVGHHTTDCTITGCVVEHCGGIGLHTGGGIKGAQFLHNVSRYNRSGFLFCQGNRNIVVSHNLVHHNQTDGIWGLDANDQACIVSDNVCHHNGHHGIEAQASVKNVIRGNVCRNNSTAAPGKYAGIFLKSAIDTLVSGNLCYDDQETPTQTRQIVNEHPKGENLIVDNLELNR